MKKGFTLLELIVVIIIIGILGTLGFTQYSTMVEKSRGAEAKAILGDIRKFAGAYRLEYGVTNSFTTAKAGIGTGSDQIPSVCAETHYFSYAIDAGAALNAVTITATRCNASGKGSLVTQAGQTLSLASDLGAGTDTWGGNGTW